MGKILLINGSPHEHGCTYTALKEIADTLSKNSVETEFFHIGKKPVAGCIACGKCSTTGKCIFDDSVNKILEKLDDYDGIIVGSPVYYAGPSGQLCAFYQQHRNHQCHQQPQRNRKDYVPNSYEKRINKFGILEHINVILKPYEFRRFQDIILCK